MTLASLSRPIRAALGSALVASSLALAPAPVQAADRGAVAAGILGGVALGALAGGAMANPAPPPPPARRVYIEEERVYAPPPPVYVERCTTEVRRHWNGYRWVEQRERFCD